jgi:hypothetical protein
MQNKTMRTLAFLSIPLYMIQRGKSLQKKDASAYLESRPRFRAQNELQSKPTPSMEVSGRGE